jgi:hypothetical protein
MTDQESRRANDIGDYAELIVTKAMQHHLDYFNLSESLRPIPSRERGRSNTSPVNK